MMSTVALKRSWAADLDTATLYKLLQLRVAVFVVEQKCAYPELDGLDLLPETRHLWLDDEGEIISTLRLLEEHEDGVKSFRIGRLCTTPPARGGGPTGPPNVHDHKVFHRNGTCCRGRSGDREPAARHARRRRPRIPQPQHRAEQVAAAPHHREIHQQRDRDPHHIGRMRG
ncbi:GNAT family N-acetyltransferase, partial [Nocardia wallacei]|uniref:GNAT family N-acetyltransferase n=1 Tax=Nocardia wallacei TaxID=480035 RepID=UPI003CC7EA9A